MEPKTTAKKMGRAADAAALSISDSEIATRAYQLWQDRGCPIGSPDDDWIRAEAELKNGLDIAVAA